MRTDVDFTVGPWRVQPRQNRISRGDDSQTLEPQVMKVLCILATRPGEVFSREALIADAWDGAVVTEEALTRCISALRRAFGDDHQHPTVIETIRKSGYRLIASVGPATPSASGAAPKGRPPRRWGWPVAVLLIVGLAALGVHLMGNVLTPDPPLSITPLTTYIGNEMQPAFSPDGSHVAFAWDKREGTHLDIYVKALHEETPLQLTADSAYEVSPTFSPDGSQIAFARVWEGCGVFVVPLVGGPERRLGSCKGWGNPQLAWSPKAEDEIIAISQSSSEQEPFQILLFSLIEGKIRPLTFPLMTSYGDRLPAFSPDGEMLAFIRTISEESDLYLQPIRGGSAQRLTFDNRTINGVTWTADGQHLIFSSNRTGNFFLWKIPAAGGTPELVLASAEALFNPILSADGDRVVYEQWSNETNIYRLPGPEAEASAEPTSFIASTRWDSEPSYSPDGQQVAFISNRSGTHEIWRSDHTGTELVRLTDFGGPVAHAPRFSPDGRRLVFYAPVDGNTDLFVMDAAGGRPRRLTDAPSIETLPSWSADGQWLYFASDRGEQWEVWKMPADGGEAVQVTQSNGFMAQPSPDGQHLYFTRRDTPGLWRSPIDEDADAEAQTPLLVFDLLPQTQWGNWTVTPTGLYFVYYDAMSGPHLARFDLNTSQVTLERELPQLPRNRSLTVSSDGLWLLYAHLDRSESDLMLVEGIR